MMRGDRDDVRNQVLGELCVAVHSVSESPYVSSCCPSLPIPHVTEHGHTESIRDDTYGMEPEVWRENAWQAPLLNSFSLPSC
jgi:hypothetical protein